MIIILMFRRITRLSFQDFQILCSLHGLKVALVMGLQVTQWQVALPGEPVETWVMLVTVYMLVRRLPFLPNADLVFLGVGLSLVGLAASGDDALSGVLLASAVTMQLVHAPVFLLMRDRPELRA